jgi:N-formylglutamate amidohydrolase
VTAEAWRITRGDDPIIATAIHAGHDLRPEMSELMKLSEEDQRREEDPYTDLWVGIAKNSIVVDRSRFEVDLNRPRDRAVYLEPDDAWGLDVWSSPPPPDVRERSLELYDRFYEELGAMCDELVEIHGHVLVLDLHSYNHRRSGQDGPVDDPALNPEINLGTETINPAWAPVLQSFSETLNELPFYDEVLDVRENVKFKGGAMTRWINGRYADRGCSIAVEMKKIYMDEWTGVMDEGITAMITRTLEVATESARSSLSAPR